MNWTQSARLFRAYQSKLYSASPQAKQLADQLVTELVDCRVALAEEIWPVLWTKPLYTFRSTKAGNRYVAHARDEMQTVWRERNDVSLFYLEQREKADRPSASGKKNVDFVNASTLVEKFRVDYGIPYQRSFSMLGALRHLKAVHDKDPTAPPFAYLAKMPMKTALPFLHDRLGWGWAQVTASHFLTDLGLACKPDRHLMRSIRAIGLTTIASDNPSTDEVAQIVDDLRYFLPYAYGADTPANFRHMDKTLMEMSRTPGILP